MVIKMGIYDMKTTGGFRDTLVYTAPDGSQRFDRETIEKKTSEDPAFGTVMTADELQEWIDSEISRNQSLKKTMADLIKDSCPGWSTGRFRFAGEAKTYSYYEFVEEMERRSAASMCGEQEVPVPGKKTVSRAVSVSEETSVSKERPVSEEQIAFLFEDRTSVDAAKTARERWEQSFNGIGIHAPEAVKQAWLDAAEIAGVDGLGVSKQGKLTHISQMMVQRCILWQRGEDGSDLLGNSVQSAIRAAERALYDLEHPLEPGRAVSPEKRLNMEKEKTFYLEFMKRLLDIA